MKITQILMGAHNAQLTCYLQDPCTEMPALDRCPAILIFPGGAYAFCSDREADPVALPELTQYVQQEPGSRGISVNDLQFYSNKMFDEEKLAALNEALVKLN